MQKTIILDLDGTLIDSANGIVEAFNFAMTQNGLPSQPAKEIIKHIGYPLEHMFGQYTSTNFVSLKNDFREKAVQTVVQASSSLEGAHDTVVSLFESGYKLGIATTKIRTHIDGILHKLGWGNYFSEVIGGDEVTKVKPDPGAVFLTNGFDGGRPRKYSNCWGYNKRYFACQETVRQERGGEFSLW